MVQVRLSGPGRFVVAGAPSYLARRGTPQKPAEHDCICVRSTTSGGRFAWELERGKKDWRVPVQGAGAVEVDLPYRAASRTVWVWGIGGEGESGISHRSA